MALGCFALRHSLVGGCKASAGENGGPDLVALGPLEFAGQRPSSSDCERGPDLFEAGRRRSAERRRTCGGGDVSVGGRVHGGAD